MDLTVHERIALGNGILTVENEPQAWARARVDEQNKGGGAAIAAMVMALPPPEAERRRMTATAKPANQRGAARLAAVQALYQMDVGRQSLEDTLAQFKTYNLGREIEGEQYLPADADFFGQIVRGVIKSQLDIDPDDRQRADRGLAGRPHRRDAARHPPRRDLRAAAPPRHPAGRRHHRICRCRQGVLRGRGARSMVNGVLDAIAKSARPAPGARA